MKKKYKKIKKRIKKLSKKHLTKKEMKQLVKYIHIFNKHSFSKHWEVNNYIDKKDKWDKFRALRSHNDHGHHKDINGITRKYYAIICDVLKIDGGNGQPLIKAVRY